MNKRVLSIFVMILFFSNANYATIYVVDQKNRSANDAGPGTEKQPFKTIGAAVNKVRAGDIIRIRAGIYRESVNFKASGTKDSLITVEVADPGKVIMRGSVVVSGWKRVESPSPVYLHEGWTKYFGPRTPGEKDARGKPRNQLFSDGTYIEEVFQPENLKENSFYIDKEKQQIHLWLSKGEDPNKKMIELSDREYLFNIISKDYVVLRGIMFEHGTCAAQRPIVRVTGNNCLIEDCKISWVAATGLSLSGRNNIVRRCVFNNNGQQGFVVSSSADCRLEDCESSYNNWHPNKSFSFTWEAGGNKIARSYKLVIERHQAYNNNGNGIWFDISNNDCEIKNCVCTGNKKHGIEWEISYKAYIHDNVVIGNSNEGILIAESIGPVIERNIMLDNLNGLTFRDMLRTTSSAVDATLSRGKEEAIWNHNEVINYNVMAFNKNCQVKGAFLNKIERLMPTALQKRRADNQRVDSVILDAQDYQAVDEQGQPLGLSLEKLNIKVDNNIYWGGTNRVLYQWGDLKFESLEQIRNNLNFEENGKIIDPRFADWKNLDLRVPKDSPLLRAGCYPKGEIPGVKLGVQ